MIFSIESSEWTALLWRASWQAAILLAIVFVVIRLAKPWIAAKYRVVLWAVPIARMLLLIAPASSFSLFYVVNSLPRNTFTQNERATQVSAPINTSTLTVVDSFGERESVPLANAEAAFATLASNAYVAGQHRPINVWSIDAWTIAFYVWLVGFLIAATRWVWSVRVLQQTIRASQPLHCVRTDFSGWLPPLGWRRIRVLVTEQELGPATTGVFRPVILIPKRLVESLNDEQLESILCHERQHICRLDALLLAACRLATTVHWFNPLAYLSISFVRREMELAVDSATIRGLGDRQRRSYGQLLLQLAGAPDNPLGLLQMASRRSKIRARIDAIASPERRSWRRSATAMLVILVIALTGLSDTAQTQDAQTQEIAQTQETSAEIEEAATDRYYIVGRVTEQGTNKPVSEAALQFLVDSEQDPDKRVPKTRTDEQGNYRVEVPMGDVKLWFPPLKPGYWLASDEAMANVSTSPSEHEATLNIVARSAPVWQVQAIGDAGEMPILSMIDEGDPEKRKAFFAGEQVQWQTSPAQAFSSLDDQGRGAFTQIGTSGGLLVGVVNVNGEIVFERGFDNTQVVSARRLPDSEATELIDVAGKKATVTVATVTLNDGVPLLTYQLKPQTPKATQRLTGRVIGPNDQPVIDARIGVAVGSKKAGSAVWPSTTQTDAAGHFKLDVPIPNQRGTGAMQFSAVINKQGFASMDTPPLDTTSDFAPLDFGSIKLSAGFAQPIVVLSEAGTPLAGAVVEPGNDYALRRQAQRTDADGRAVLDNLPAGLVKLTARHGNQHASAKLVVSDDPAENTIATIRLSDLATPDADRGERPVPIAVGKQAPDLQVQTWTDGKFRNVSDYRGKVVVIDFWGMWCSPCLNAIPAMQGLADRYESEDVVFLGIHTADGDVSQVQKLKKSTHWTTPSGIDIGSSMINGETCKAYGVRGYPSIVIIDRNGKIAFNSGVEPKDRDAFMQQMNELAKTNGIPWPPDPDGDEEQAKESMNNLMQAMFGREIERLLKP